MLVLEYIPVDEDHEGAVKAYNTMDIQMTEEGIQFYEPETELKRCVTFDKLTKISFTAEISDGLRNKATNLDRLATANSAAGKKKHGRATVQ